MRVLGITPENKITGETPEQLYLKKLELLGHEIIIKSPDEITTEDCMWCEVVASLSETTCETGWEVSARFNKPFYAHMEWIPKWRVFIEPEHSWGMEERGHTYKEKMNFIRMYQHYIDFWNRAHAKSISAECFIEDAINFLGSPTRILIKYLGPDTTKLIEEDKTDLKEEHEITCIARFVPHKRLHHVIKALKQINFDGVLNLVGYGPEQKRYDYTNSSTTPIINIKYFDSKDKYVAIKRSKLVVALWSGIVPSEAMWLGKPCVTYESPYMKELYGNTLVYAVNNDWYDLSYKIKKVLDMNSVDRLGMASRGRESIENNKINTFVLEESVKKLEKLILEAMRIHDGESKTVLG